MTELDKLLECDDENVQVSKHNLVAGESRTIELIESCALALKHLSAEYGKVCEYDSHQERLEAVCKTIPGYNQEMLEQIYDLDSSGLGDKTGPVLIAHNIILDELAVFARVMLLLRMGRELMFSMSDLLRMRVSSSMGVLRTQAESIALVKMIGVDPSLGKKWLDTGDDEKGKAFYNSTSNKLVPTIKELGLFRDYQRGSNMGLHPRASGVVDGMLQAGAMADNDGGIGLVFQEAMAPEKLLFWYCVHMKFYRVVIENARMAVPELDADFFRHKPIFDFLVLEESVRSNAGRLIAEVRQAQGGDVDV